MIGFVDDDFVLCKLARREGPVCSPHLHVQYVGQQQIHTKSHVQYVLYYSTIQMILLPPEHWRVGQTVLHRLRKSPFGTLSLYYEEGTFQKFRVENRNGEGMRMAQGATFANENSLAEAELSRTVLGEVQHTVGCSGTSRRNEQNDHFHRPGYETCSVPPKPVHDHLVYDFKLTSSVYSSREITIPHIWEL